MGGALALSDIDDDAAADVVPELELLEHAAAVTVKATAAMSHVVLRIPSFPSLLPRPPPLSDGRSCTTIRYTSQAPGTDAAEPNSHPSRSGRASRPSVRPAPSETIKSESTGKVGFPGDMDCHGSGDAAVATAERPIVLVGNPNVGKSALFGRLTGRYVAVSNYPGTTVEVARGTLAVNGHRAPMIDTPGVHDLAAISDDERVTRDILLTQPAAAVVQVIDAKNLRRGLLLSVQLAEAGVPLVVALNMADEAERRGLRIDARALGHVLGAPVVATVATKGDGVERLGSRLDDATPGAPRVDYGPEIERAIALVEAVVPAVSTSARATALLLLACGDDLVDVLGLDGPARATVADARHEAESLLGRALGAELNRRRMAVADAIVAEVVTRERATGRRWDALGRWATDPVWGWPILLAVLAALFAFVGILGATVLVGLLENGLFGEVINPAATRLVDATIPFPLVRDLLVGPYGIVTMGLTYGFAIVLPLVVTFFLAFGVLEDSGYLPRLAVMLDRAFRMMGLNGRAVIPMILGLGCDTMATVTTRTLESRKERLQVTLLLALAVPCSAQLGVILGMISWTGALGAAIWSAIVAGTLLSVGWLSARVIPGPRSDFIVELPPMRVPSLRNVAVKTAARLEWYLKEVIPVFVLGTVALFVLDATGALAWAERTFSPLISGWLGLPEQATGSFLIGFLRRDYGAAGLFALAQQGALTGNQILVSLVVITLFIPCIATVLMIVREHGTRTALAVTAFVFPFAVLVGGLLNLALKTFGIEVG
jgi:ferrous iron transport protein B